MPIDYLGRKIESEKSLNDYLASLPSQYARQASIRQGDLGDIRSRILGSGLQDILAGASGRYGLPSVSADTGLLEKSLAKKALDVETARQFQLNRDRSNLVLNNLYNRLVESGMNESDAIAYSRELALKNKQQEFAASQLESEGAAKMRLSDIADQYAQMGIDLKSQYMPEGPDYWNAVERSLIGIAGKLGAYHFLGKSKFYNPYGATF